MEAKNVNAEDFIFSGERLWDAAIVARETNKIVTRKFINGQEFTNRIPAGTVLDYQDKGTIVVANVSGASEENQEFLISCKDESCEDVLFILLRNIDSSLLTSVVNPYLTISILANFENDWSREEKPCIQEGAALVRITDRELDNKETFFMIHSAVDLGRGFLPVKSYQREESTELTVHLCSKGYWDKCYLEKERYGVDRLYDALIIDIQSIYYQINKENSSCINVTKK